MNSKLPLPPHFDPHRVGEVWRVPYHDRAEQAKTWAKQHQIAPAAQDQTRVCLMAIDVQNTFCIPGFELFWVPNGTAKIIGWERRIERQREPGNGLPVKRGPLIVGPSTSLLGGWKMN